MIRDVNSSYRVATARRKTLKQKIKLNVPLSKTVNRYHKHHKLTLKRRWKLQYTFELQKIQMKING